ncbi:conserved exported hypothetical protein [Tenacibaculum sediminilitoris]|uniref:hypothetical protein n=1 Tax=Tenacibaculum sediminilitoris TaxID=1820334 RepID=UPI003894DEC4
MKTLKFLAALTLFTAFVHTQQIVAQDDIKELKIQVKNKENQINANEEILVSGVTALKRVKTNFERFKKNKKATKQEIERKEKIVANMQQRLTKLNAQVDNQKKDLNILERKLARKLKKEEAKEEDVKEEGKAATASNGLVVYEDNISDEQKEVLLQKQKLEEARKKLDEERKARELAYLKEQEALRLEEEKLKQLSNQIKAKEKNISKEKNTLISDLEDDISINEEILISGKEGLAKMKSKLEKAKKDATTSKESIERKQVIIDKIENRLLKIENEIDVKKQELAKIKG